MSIHGTIYTIHRGHGRVTLQREQVKGIILDLILEGVHPGNMGELPPSPDRVAHKAVQVGLISSLSEAYEKVTVYHS